jgi:hypothetical protein
MNLTTHTTSPNAEPFDPAAALERLLAEVGLCSADAGGSVTFAGADPIFESRLRLAAAIGIPVMAGAVGAAAIWLMRTGRGRSGSTPTRSRSAAPESSPSRSAPMGMTARGPTALVST